MEPSPVRITWIESVRIVDSLERSSDAALMIDIVRAVRKRYMVTRLDSVPLWHLPGIIGSQRWAKKNAALQIGSEDIELVTHRHLQPVSTGSHSACCFSHSTPSRSTSLMEGCKVDATRPFECQRRKRQLHNVRWTSTMYWVHLDSGANQGEIPGIGESPSNQPISGQVIFSKRQALSRAVVVNSNISRGKYLAREGPGSRL